MTYTQTEIVGFGNNFLELIDEEEPVLEKGGLKVDEFRRDVSKKLETATKANARQEDLKRQLKEATRAVEAANDDLYRTTSGYLDACIGVVGKGGPAAKNFRRLRSRIRMPGAQGGAPSDKAVTVEPLPEAEG